MKTFALAGIIFMALLSCAGAVLMLNRIATAANSGRYSDADSLVLIAFLGGAALFTALTITTAKDKG